MKIGVAILVTLLMLPVYSYITTTLIPSMQPDTAKTSTTIRETRTNNSVTTNTYDKGITAPAAVAYAPAAGALSVSTILTSPWFAAFLLLLAFSTFSLIMIRRHA